MQNGISSLPAELLVTIRRYFGIPELFEFSGTCKYYRKIFEPDIFVAKVYISHKYLVNPCVAVKVDDLEFYSLFGDISYGMSPHARSGDLSRERYFGGYPYRDVALAMMYGSEKFLTHPNFQMVHPEPQVSANFQLYTKGLSQEKVIIALANMKRLGYLPETPTFKQLVKYFDTMSLVYITDRCYPQFRRAILSRLKRKFISEEEYPEVIRITSKWRHVKERKFPCYQSLKGDSSNEDIFHGMTVPREIGATTRKAYANLLLLQDMQSWYRTLRKVDHLEFLNELSTKDADLLQEYLETISQAILNNEKFYAINVDDIISLENYKGHKLSDFSYLLNTDYLRGNKKRFIEYLKSTNRKDGISILEEYCFKCIDCELLEIFFKDKFWFPKRKNLEILSANLYKGGTKNLLRFLEIFATSNYSSLLETVKIPMLYSMFINNYKLTL